MNDIQEPRLIIAVREIKVLSFLTKLPSNIFTIKLKDIYFPKETMVDDLDSIKGVYIVTEYVKLDLFKTLADSISTFTHNQAISLTYNLLCAVKHVNSANIIHRDLKPQNILVTD